MTESSAELPAQLVAVVQRASSVANAFAEAGYQLALVGGVVRDHLLGDVGDLDLDATTDARPPAIKQIVGDLAEAVWTQGERFGTIGCQIAGQPWEITTYRAEAYDHDSRKPMVSFGDDLEGDLARRDFTINAMAVDVITGRLIDPFDGRTDLASRRLATPLDPDVSFSDDPLRMLRAARFIARFDLEPDPALVAAIEGMRDRLAIVSIERVFDELTKLLVLPTAGRGLRFAADVGLWPQAVAEVALSSETVGRVEAAQPSPIHRWAALLLDHPEPSTVMAGLRSSTAVQRSVAALSAVAHWPATFDVEWTRRRAAAGGGGVFDDQIRFGTDLGLVDGDRLTDMITRLRREEPDVDDPVPPLDGNEVAEILGVSPGPVVGRAMNALAEHRFGHGPFNAAVARHLLAEWSDSLLASSDHE